MSHHVAGNIGQPPCCQLANAALLLIRQLAPASDFLDVPTAAQAHLSSIEPTHLDTGGTHLACVIATGARHCGHSLHWRGVELWSALAYSSNDFASRMRCHCFGSWDAARACSWQALHFAVPRACWPRTKP